MGDANQIYSTSKIVWHPEVLDALRYGNTVRPIYVQWFPTNLCNAACNFCSYGHWKDGKQGPPPERWKNNELFEDNVSMPVDKMRETTDCLHKMGVKAVEISGGGEPTTYPHFDELVSRLSTDGLEIALVTNGVLVDQKRAQFLMQENKAVWVRVSLDAGDEESYCTTRNVPKSQFYKALEAIGYLAQNKTHPESRVGVGFVVDTSNWNKVYQGVQLAYEHGADNVRLSVAFTPEGSDRWRPSQMEEAQRQAKEAKSVFENQKKGFSVIDLINERVSNTYQPVQNYPYCFWKDVACVIGADCCVYSCCSLAYNTQGIVGSIKNQSFEELWYSSGVVDWRQEHKPCYDCPVFCLMEQRNRNTLRCMIDPSIEEEERKKAKPLHINYI